MTQSVSAAISKLSELIATIPQIKAAPAVPTESINVFPFAVIYERSAETVLLSDGFANDLVQIVVEFHLSRQFLPGVLGIADSIRNQFLDKLIEHPTLDGTVSTIQSVDRVFGAMDYGSTQSIGYRFTLEVKIQL